MSNEEKSFPKTSINWYPGHMAKTKREIRERLNLIDIVIEVIDARIPLSSKNKDIDTLVGNKPRVLVMTKIDLCDMEVTSKWKDYYQRLGYEVVLVDLINNKNIKEIFGKIGKMSLSINQKRKEKGLKPRKTRLLVLGVPNVGKSTLINRLINKKAVNVGNKPGITKQLQWIRINDDIELLDTPGILWPKLDNEVVALNLASMTAIKEEILDLQEVSIYIVNKLLKMYPDNLINRYDLEDTSDMVGILDNIGKKIGAVRNREVDYDRVYLTIFRDLRDGYLGKVTFDEFIG